MLHWIYKHRIRILLNVLAWAFLFEAAHSNTRNYHPAEGMQTSFLLHTLCYNLLFFAASNLHTLWLMPRYFITRRYKIYAPALAALITIFTIAISRYNVWMIQYFKGLEDGNFSAISISTKGGHMSWLDYYLAVAPSLLLVLFVFSIGFLMQQYFRVKRQQEVIGKQQIESELSLLKSQVNPHFLFNVLNSIYALSLKKSDKTPEIVLKLSDILRYMLYETKQEQVALEKELEMIESYIDIEKVRIGNPQQIALHIKSDADTYVIAPMLLIPFIENTIKHGLDSMSENAFVSISIEINRGVLEFHCSNNFKPTAPRKVGGIGLANVQKRLALIYPHKHHLQIRNENSIFTITLKLTLNG